MSWTPEHKAELERIKQRLIEAIDTLTKGPPYSVLVLAAKMDVAACLDRLMSIKKEIER